MASCTILRRLACTGKLTGSQVTRNLYRTISDVKNSEKTKTNADNKEVT